MNDQTPPLTVARHRRVRLSAHAVLHINVMPYVSPMRPGALVLSVHATSRGGTPNPEPKRLSLPRRSLDAVYAAMDALELEAYEHGVWPDERPRITPREPGGAGVRAAGPARGGDGADPRATGRAGTMFRLRGRLSRARGWTRLLPRPAGSMRATMKDITGQTFGRLLVLWPAGSWSDLAHGCLASPYTD